METPSNPLFSNDLNEYEQYIMFMGYLDRYHEEMCIKSGTDKRNHKIDDFVMALLHKKVIDMVFPDGKYDMEHLKYIGKQMNKLNMSDRIGEIVENIHRITMRFNVKDVKGNPDLARIIWEDLNK